MATKNKMQQPKQRLIYSQDASMNFSASSMNNNNNNNNTHSDLMNLFKSSASLSRSLRNATTKTGANAVQKDSLFKSSGDLIMNNTNTYTARSFKGGASSTSKCVFAQTMPNFKPSNTSISSKASFKPAVSSSSRQIQIRNIIHDYTNVDVNSDTYNILSALTSHKRATNLDILDDYEVWKTNHFNNTEKNVKRVISELQCLLQNTKDEIFSKFTMQNESLIPLTQIDIDNVTSFYNNVIIKRNESITQTHMNVLELFTKCCTEIKNKIALLIRELDLTGYMLQEEIKSLTDEKTLYIIKLTECKKKYYTKIINEIRDNEMQIVNNSKHEHNNFIQRWKNIKLNNYFIELKTFLSSTAIIDNSERYILIDNMKRDQMAIYAKRKSLIFDKLFKLSYEDITTKNIETISKELDDIYTEAEKIFINHIQLLVENSDNIHRMSLNEVEKFKMNVASVSYDFTVDNHNNKQYNDYDELTSIDELIDKEIMPIINTNKQNRIDYSKVLNAYIDEYDDYTNNIAIKIIAMYLSLGKLFDDHKKHMISEERKYLFSIAKATDNDDDFINEKEEIIKGHVSKMAQCETKEQLDELLSNCFQVMDELEKEYRTYFQTIDELFTSHDNVITNVFNEYESKVLQVFGYYTLDHKYEIEKRRVIENDFCIKKKEAEIAHEEALQAEEEAKNAEKQGKKPKAPVKKVNDKKSSSKKQDDNTQPPREILTYTSKLNNEYLIDFTCDELIRHLLRNVIYNRDDDIFELKPKTPEELERLRKEKEEREQREKELNENPKAKKPGSRASKKDNKKERVDTQQSLPSESNVDYYTAFDPYKADSNKVFSSPVSQTDVKLLSEENCFNEVNIVKGVCELFDKLTDAIVEAKRRKIEESHVEDNERREEALTELDLRLKLLAPKKGKIEVEQYDERLSEIELIEKKRKREEMIKKQKEEEERKKNGEVKEDDVKGEEQTQEVEVQNTEKSTGKKKESKKEIKGTNKK